MESRGASLKGASHAHWLLTKIGVAMALAVIKSRPSGMSGREHAEALSRQLRDRDDDLRRKVQELQQEVLRLRQEVVMSRATSAVEAAGQDSVDASSQDLFDPEFLDLPLSDTPELLPDAPPSHVPFPPLGMTPPNLQFLQSLCELNWVRGNQHPLESLWLGPNGETVEVVVESVCRLLDSVVAACNAPPPPSGPCDLVLEACRVASRATELFCSQRSPTDEFTRRVEAPLRELTEVLLNCDQTRGLQTADRLTQLLLTLGGCSMLRSFLIRHFLSQISAVAEQLWQAYQGQQSFDAFPVGRYHNSGRLFWILEELLQNSKVPVRAQPDADHTGFLSHLDQRVFLLSEEFPLFSICMWRIGGLLAASDGSDPPTGGEPDQSTSL